MYLLKRFGMTAFILSIVFLLAACASEPEDTGSEETTDNGEEAVTEGEGGDLIIAKGTDVVSLDPNGSNDISSYDVQRNIFETLVKQNENLELVPGLAKEWEAIEDNVWEFKLQEGVTFHDGSPFNAEVAKANIERIIDPEVGSSQASLYEMINDIEVVDDYTIRLTTDYPFAPLPAHLAHPVSGIVSLEVIEEDYAAMEDGAEPGTIINENPIGTGYFKFDEWVTGEYVDLSKNEDYWDGTALLDTVRFKVVNEDLTRIAELSTGDSHVSSPLSTSDVGQIEQMDGVSVHQQSIVRYSYVGFNMDKEPFDNQLVRQAISMAVDKELIIDGIFEGYGIPANTPIPRDIEGHDETVEDYEYDVEGAKELLAEAGYEDGFSTTIWTDDEREQMDTAVNVQSQLAEIGIDAEVEVLEWGAYLEQTANGEHDMFVIGWTSGTGDPDYSVYSLFHSNSVGAPGNRTFTENEELDALLDEARQTTDVDDRMALYSEIQELLVDIAPAINISYPEYLMGVDDSVKGLSQLPTQYLELKDVYIE
ncbi:glutathione ABC transporter substrate-binding protein [Virgibacillus sp. YIM 98842]|uniref:glutathione ABC transporter substrate-binding protein n=1 Tax=Virgibacillus sp. YIM 98842 TaxID=2663533 RepID=UPI0013DC915E|nr:glutathione ABC transporter substrate-binding protein [Virgibacillus sp. YIM 98842]